MSCIETMENNMQNMGASKAKCFNLHVMFLYMHDLRISESLFSAQFWPGFMFTWSRKRTFFFLEGWVFPLFSCLCTLIFTENTLRLFASNCTKSKDYKKMVQFPSCGEKPLQKQIPFKWALIYVFSRIQVYHVLDAFRYTVIYSDAHWPQAIA